MKNQTNVEANEKKVQRKIVGKTKIYRIRSQQIRESCCGWKEEEEENGTIV